MHKCNSNNTGKQLPLLSFGVFLCLTFLIMVIAAHPLDRWDNIKYQPVPSIEYKYIQKTLLPQQTTWWKRGTHHVYAGDAEVVEP